MKILFAVNGLCIVGMFGALIWAMLAIGNHEQFQDRFLVVFALQGICVVFMVIRRIWKLTRT